MFGSFGFSDLKFNSVVIRFDVVYWVTGHDVIS